MESVQSRGCRQKYDITTTLIRDIQCEKFIENVSVSHHTVAKSILIPV